MRREISRQTFVRGAVGAIAAGALFGSARASGLPAPQYWAALDDAIEGEVVLPSSGQFGSATAVVNTRFAGAAPAAVVTVKSTSDVQKAVAFAAKTNIKIAARSGGHSYIGASAANGAMIVDLRQLPGGVTYDDGSGLATVSAAADINAVQTALAARGRAIPTGTCPTVGIAGLTLGGGMGPDSRRSGLTCDTLASASVVLPSGEAVTASPGDHNDLYWALRGGGGGNFGITTSFSFRTFGAVDVDAVTVVFPEQAIAQTILGWHNWLRSADRAIWAMVDVNVDPGTGLRCGVVLVTPAGGGPRAAAGLSAAIGLQPVSNESRTLSHLDLMRQIGGPAEASQPHGFVAGSDIIATMTPAAAESIAAAISAWPRTTGHSETFIKPLDGAVAAIGPGGTAFPWRTQAACVQWYADTPSAPVVNAANQWVASAHQAVRANSVGAYVNYVEPSTSVARYFDGNLGRLTAVRQKYDPGQLMYSGLNF